MEINVSNQSYPTFNSPESYALPTGMYLGLFHGRDRKDEDPDDWGFDGPVIGPLEFVHTTYANHIKVCLVGRQQAEMDLELVEGMIEFEGKYYGDWTVYFYEQRRQACVPVAVERRTA